MASTTDRMNTDEIRFGTYPYEADGTGRPIEWLILRRQGTKALLVSKAGLDAVSYDPGGETTWENCALRRWLNKEFLKNAFTEEEQAAILETELSADSNPDFETPSGNSTVDRVFLLSIPEARRLFRSNKQRVLTATPFAEKNGACVNEISGTSWWWLRSPGSSPKDAAIVNLFGSVRTDGNYVGALYDCVRPAMWADLKKMTGLQG